MNNAVATLAEHPAVSAVRARLAATDPDTLALQARLSTIPSPTGAERQRGLFVCDVMKSIGLDEVTIDDVGNRQRLAGEERSGGHGRLGAPRHGVRH